MKKRITVMLDDDNMSLKPHNKIVLRHIVKRDNKRIIPYAKYFFIFQ